MLSFKYDVLWIFGTFSGEAVQKSRAPKIPGKEKQKQVKNKPVILAPTLASSNVYMQTSVMDIKLLASDLKEQCNKV